AGAAIAGADKGDWAAAGDRRARVARDERTVAELSAIVAAPARQHAIRADCASVRCSGTDLSPGKAPGDSGGCGAARGEVAELSLVVRPPAVCLAGLRDRARVSAARADRDDFHAREHTLGRRRAWIEGRLGS